MNNKGQLLQDPFLNALRREHVPVFIYLALEFDAVDQVNGHWHMLTTQCVEEGILQKLPFVVHDILRVLN